MLPLGQWATSDRMPANREILDEVNRAGSWFRAKKSRPIWVRRVLEDQTLETLEGVERVRQGDYVCRGENGDVWPQSAAELERKYRATATVDADGWQMYEPHPDNQGVLAAQIDHSFTVVSLWGNLHGKQGDFIVKNYHEKDTDYPEDVWIVDQDLFRSTYSAGIGTMKP